MILLIIKAHIMFSFSMTIKFNVTMRFHLIGELNFLHIKLYLSLTQK